MKVRSIDVVVLSDSSLLENSEDTLASLAAQRFTDGFTYQVLLIDLTQGRRHDTAEALVSRYKMPLRILSLPGCAVPAAMNRGIRESKGQIVVFTAGDVVMDSRSLSNFRQCFHDCDCDAAGGRVLLIYHPRSPGWATRFKYILAGPFGFHDYGPETKPYDRRMMAPFLRLNLAARRESFFRYGNFDTDLLPGRLMAGEDHQLFRRWETSGARLVYCGQSLAYHKIERVTTGYVYAARWFIDYGRYYARKSYREKGVYYLGLPRWKLRHLFTYILRMLCNLFDRRVFLECWREVFSRIGEIIEYRSLRNGERQRDTAGL